MLSMITMSFEYVAECGAQQLLHAIFSIRMRVKLVKQNKSSMCALGVNTGFLVGFEPTTYFLSGLNK